MSVSTMKPIPDLAYEAPRKVIGPRESMRVLPSFMQLPITLLTGKPHVGQRRLLTSPTYHLLAAIFSMAIGVTASFVGWFLGGAWLLLLAPGWAMTLHGMRNLRMMIYHQCAHRNMYGQRKLDVAIGRLISSLLVIQNFQRYRQEHVSDHHAVHHMTLQDPTVQAFLRGLDLHPGMRRAQMWHRLIGKLLSPKFHATFAVARVRSFLYGSAPSEKLTIFLVYTGITAIVVITNTWLPFLVVWVIPLVPFFQVSYTLRLCVKHTFPSPDVTDRRGKEYFANLTNAVFLGEVAPSSPINTAHAMTDWLRWVWRMIFVHFPARYLVLTGDTVCHDYHHRHPASKQWHNYIFARQDDDEAGHPGWPPYQEVWGLVPAINRVFDSLFVADAEYYDVRRISSVSKRELFSAFDD